MTEEDGTALRQSAAAGGQLATAFGTPGAALATQFADEAQRLRGQFAPGTVSGSPGSGGAFERLQVTHPLALALSWVSLTLEQLADAHGASDALSHALTTAARWAYVGGRDMLHAVQAEIAAPVLPRAPAGPAANAASIEALARRLARLSELPGPGNHVMLTPADRAATVPALASALGAVDGCARALAARAIPGGERDALDSAAWALAIAHRYLPHAGGPSVEALAADRFDPGNANWLRDRIRWLPAACKDLQGELDALGPIATATATPAMGRVDHGLPDGSGHTTPTPGDVAGLGFPDRTAFAGQPTVRGRAAAKTSWSGQAENQLVAALARKGWDRDRVRSACRQAADAGSAEVASKAGDQVASVTFGDTEVDLWDAEIRPAANGVAQRGSAATLAVHRPVSAPRSIGGAGRGYPGGARGLG